MFIHIFLGRMKWLWDFQIETIPTYLLDSIEEFKDVHKVNIDHLTFKISITNIRSITKNISEFTDCIISIKPREVLDTDIFNMTRYKVL